MFTSKKCVPITGTPQFSMFWNLLPNAVVLLAGLDATVFALPGFLTVGINSTFLDLVSKYNWWF